MSPVHCVQRVSITLAALLVMPVYVSLAAPALPGAMQYDIPTSELNKVRKELPSKRGAAEPRKKRKSDVKPQETAPAAGTAVEPAAQPKTATVEPVSPAPPRTAAAASPLPADSIRIHHAPYSFVVAGKRTVIQAVVSSESETRNVFCRFRTKDGDVLQQVTMDKAPGSRFTYVAILPGLPAHSTSLRYSITAVDATGRELSSQEYLTPVTTSPIVPGWQIEDENVAKPPEQGPVKKPLDLSLPR